MQVYHSNATPNIRIRSQMEKSPLSYRQQVRSFPNYHSQMEKTKRTHR